MNLSGEPHDDDTKLERMLKLWNKVPSEERRKVTKLLAGEVNKRAMAEHPGEPSDEYGAFQVAHWLLHAAIENPTL